jgi:hypothetical protein
MNILPSVFESFSLVVSSEVQHKERQILVKITINRKAMSSQGNYRSTSVQRLAPNTIITEQSHQNMNDDADMPKRNKLDVKSLLVGFVLGLLVGLAVWWMVDSFFKTDTASKKADTEEVQNDSIFGEEVSKNAFLPAEETVESNSAPEKVGTSPVVDKGPQVEGANSKDGLNDNEIVKKEAVAQAAKEEAAKEKAELINFISKKPTLAEYRQHSGYKHLDQKERVSIEAFLNAVHNPKSYNLNGTGKNKLKELAQKKYSFKTMKDIKEVQNKIINITSNYSKK